MRILVTGATGFIGSHVARALMARGDQVRILRRPASPLDLLADVAPESVIGDLFDPESLRLACDGMQGIVHCAAEMGSKGSLESRLASHVEGTRNLLLSARGASRFVYISSVASLGFPDHTPRSHPDGIRPMDESHAWRGSASTWRYGYAKLQAEALVRTAASEGMGAVIVNPSLVIVPGDRNRVSNFLIWHMLHGRVPPLVDGGLNLVHIQDVVDGITAALDRGRAGERYLLCGENRTLADLIHTTAIVVGARQPGWRLPLRPTRAVAEALAAVAQTLRFPVTPDLLRAVGLYFYYDRSKAERELGLPAPRTYERAAAASAAWYRSHPNGVASGSL
jgi:dihydroflavonol-4-reductase